MTTRPASCYSAETSLQWSRGEVTYASHMPRATHRCRFPCVERCRAVHRRQDVRRMRGYHGRVHLPRCLHHLHRRALRRDRVRSRVRPVRRLERVELRQRELRVRRRARVAERRARWRRQRAERARCARRRRRRRRVRARVRPRARRAFVRLAGRLLCGFLWLATLEQLLHPILTALA